MSETLQHMPDAATRDRLRAAPEGPVVMMNLLKYREPGGRDAFTRYGAITAPLIQEAEGQVILAGKSLVGLTGTDVEWDDVIVVRFPSAARFLAMIESDTYTGQAAPIREEALEATLWLAMQAFPGADASA